MRTDPDFHPGRRAVGTAGRTPGHAKSRRPYTACTIRVAHPLYETLIVEDAQVFANHVSMQEAILIPLKEFENPIDSAQTVRVPSPNL